MTRKLSSGLWAAIFFAVLSAVWLTADDSPLAPGTPVRLLAVAPLEQPAGYSLEVRASGPFTFTSFQPQARHLIVDLAGVVSDIDAREQPTSSVAWLSNYRLLPFRNSSGRQVLRLEVNLSRECSIEVNQITPSALTLICPDPAGSRVRNKMAEPRKPVPAAPASQVETPVSDGPTRVNRMIVRQNAKAVTVDVLASAALRYETFKLDNPPRLVFDFPQSILVARRRKVSVDDPPVMGVRLGQFKSDPPITRLVVDLTRMISYQVNTKPTGLRLVLSEKPVAESVTEPEPAPASVEVAATSEPDPKRAAPVSESPRPAVEPLPTEASAAGGTSADEKEAEPPVLLASLAPTVPSRSSSSAAVKPAAVKPLPTPTVPEPAVPAMASLATVPMQEAPAGQEESEKVYTGEPISVNLKDVDLKDFFRLIHEISGLNIVLDPNVSGTVTLALLDVPWDQVLDIVLKNNGLGSTLEGNVLRIATLGTLKDEQQDLADLAKARLEAVAPVTVTRQLSYAKAEDLEPTLKQFLSSRGELIRDDRTNTLIIRDIPSVIPNLDVLIQQLDTKSLQVEIEARVVSASRAFTREFGSQFALSASRFRGDGSPQTIFGGDLAPSSLGRSPLFPPPLISANTDPPQQPLATNLRAVSTTSAILFGHSSPAFALDIILSAAETRQLAKVLSKPRVITQNNILARVLQGTRIPVQTVVNNTITTQFIDVALKLEVTPQITAEGTVFLDIDIENTSIDTGIARINGIPALRTQEATTQVLVTDGGTVVIGGVMITNNATSVDQVPLLGSIPIIGHLFKRSRVETITQELLFFITPRILQS